MTTVESQITATGPEALAPISSLLAELTFGERYVRSPVYLEFLARTSAPEEDGSVTQQKKTTAQKVRARWLQGLHVVFFLCAIASVAIPAAGAGKDTAALVAQINNLIWNYYDGIGGLCAADTFNKLAGVQLLAFNTFYLLSVPTIHVVTGSLATVAAICASAAFAVCMGVAFAVELWEVAQAEKRIEKLKTLRTQKYNVYENTETTLGDKATLQQEINAIDNLICVESAHQIAHKKLAVAWGLSFVVMTLVCVVGALTMTGASLGASLPFVGAGLSVAVGLYRIYLMKYAKPKHQLGKLNRTVSASAPSTPSTSGAWGGLREGRLFGRCPSVDVPASGAQVGPSAA